MFKEAKTAQMAAYLLKRQGGSLRYIKLLKMLYLADREAMRQTGDSMTRDRFFSMKNGPILSETLNLIHGKRRSAPWSHWVRVKEYCAKLANEPSDEDLDELSVFDREILDQIADRFGRMGWRALCQWTHDNCPEWRDTGKSSHPIQPSEIFQALGWSEGKARQLGNAYIERRELDRVMARYG